MKKLLIVDDDRHLLDSLRVVFTDTYEVSTALSAEEAEGLLEKAEVDVVLLDVVLPGIDGVEFLKKINATHPGLPVVMISGAPSIRPVINALELGACDYIRKPFDIDELRLVVGRAIESVRLRQRMTELERELVCRPARKEKKPLKQAVEDYEREIIKEALGRTGGVQTRAAAVLGTTRRILRYRIEKLNIEP
jgi:DNA-binding NtrC family response regulator